eukprot:TRINITY_DN2656_c0_g1_i1.p1 TRINITY_DN2656_c0_g1~~TRINITY_DN2656_c0_g1_i1.p1  ORF type:complete len:375 (+),score=86.72 TRINITY_DN2656_c0_g1_i1:462-1586(+)
MFLLLFEIFCIIGNLFFIFILIRPYQLWRKWKIFSSLNNPKNIFPSLSVLIPARNEEKHLSQLLDSLLDQIYPNYEIVIINDESTDDTYSIACEYSTIYSNVHVIDGKPHDPDWSGKLFALQQGFEQSKHDYILCLDADTIHYGQSLKILVNEAQKGNYAMLSSFIDYKCSLFGEKIFIPGLLYWFRNMFYFENGAAAGMAMLFKRSDLEELKGFSSVKNAIIDELALVKIFSKAGKKSCCGLTKNIVNSRIGGSVALEIVERDAKVLLKNIPNICVLFMFLCMILTLGLYPLYLLTNIFVWNSTLLHVVCIVEWLLASISYYPTISYLDIDRIFTVLHFIQVIGFALSGLNSVFNDWKGKIEWKGRIYLDGKN